MLAYAHTIPTKPSLLKHMAPLRVAIDRINVPPFMLNDDAEESLRLQALSRLREAGVDVIDDGPSIVCFGDLSTHLGSDPKLIISLSSVFDLFFSASVLVSLPIERSGFVATYVSRPSAYVAVNHVPALKLLDDFIAAWLGGVRK